jgi:hypothetical protein
VDLFAQVVSNCLRRTRPSTTLDTNSNQKSGKGVLTHVRIPPPVVNGSLLLPACGLFAFRCL